MPAINLLPPEVRPAPPRLLPGGILGSLALAFAVMVVIYSFLWSYNTWVLSRRLLDIRREIAQVQPREQEARRTEERLKTLRQKKEELERLGQERFNYSDFLAALSSALPSEAWLTKLEIKQDQEFLLTGRASRLEAVGKFLSALENLPNLEEVTLEAVQAAKEGGNTLEFTVKARIKKAGQQPGPSGEPAQPQGQGGRSVPPSG